MSAPDIHLRHYTVDDLAEIRPVLITMYAEIYQDRLDHPFWSIEAFQSRLDNQTHALNWESVVGYQDTEPVGYIYAAPLGPGSRWWADITPPITDPDFTTETGNRTLGIFELMIRQPWRGTGTAQRIHDELRTGRGEPRVSLAVERDHPRVRALYERWGYRYVGSEQPMPGGPILDVLVADES